DIRKFDAYSVITRDEIGFKYFTNASEFNHHRIFSKCCNFYSDMWLPFGSIFPKSGYDSSVNLFGSGALLSGLSASMFTNAYTCIMVGRTIQGIGAAGAAPIAMALTGDLFKGSEQSRVLGIFEASNGVGKVLSPILGSLVGLFIWYMAFF